jgi:hypothetical protein
VRLLAVRLRRARCRRALLPAVRQSRCLWRCVRSRTAAVWPCPR